MSAATYIAIGKFMLILPGNYRVSMDCAARPTHAVGGSGSGTERFNGVHNYFHTTYSAIRCVVHRLRRVAAMFHILSLSSHIPTFCLARHVYTPQASRWIIEVAAVNPVSSNFGRFQSR